MKFVSLKTVPKSFFRQKELPVQPLSPVLKLLLRMDLSCLA